MEGKMLILSYVEDEKYLDPISQCGLRGLDGYLDAADWAFVKDNYNGHVHFIGRGMSALETWCANAIAGMDTILPSERLHNLTL
jgi:hypothetical protein